MLKLFQFPPNQKSINYSPFCLKLETFLKMTSTPYEVVTGNDVRKGPKKKMPYVEIDGRRMGDSTLIIEHLMKQSGNDLDAKLSPLEKSQSRAYRRMIEEASIYPFLYFRWVEEKSWRRMNAKVFSGLPIPLKWFLPNKIRNMVAKKVVIQGTGRHSPEEIGDMLRADLKALSDFLGGRRFFFGDDPTLLDASAFGFLNNVVNDPFEGEVTEYARSLGNLGPYCERMRAKYFA